MGRALLRAAGVSLPRFHVPAAAPGARVALPEHAAHHAREVLRLRHGAEVRIFDGAGHEFAATLDTVTRAAVSAHLTGAVAPRPESPLRLVLALSPLKGDHMELVIQKATELGVSEIRPVVTARTDAAARPALTGSRQQRWDRVASGAAEQCGRATVPSVAPTITLDRLLSEPFEGRKVLLLERGLNPPLASLGPCRALQLLIGPAGGWEDWEAARLAQARFTPVSLGPRILRAETAAVAGVALAQSLWGDLG
jgi:16S rRNA (uracil1498-N3)-methyltransferase